MQCLKISVFVLVIAIFTGACGFRVPKEKIEKARNKISLNPGLEPIHYSRVRTEVFEPSCLGCHGASSDSDGGGVRFLTFEETVNHLSLIENEALITKGMPLGDSLSPGQMDLLQSWIDQGAPQ